MRRRVPLFEDAVECGRGAGGWSGLVGRCMQMYLNVVDVIVGFYSHQMSCFSSRDCLNCRTFSADKDSLGTLFTW